MDRTTNFKPTRPRIHPRAPTKNISFEELTVQTIMLTIYFLVSVVVIVLNFVEIVILKRLKRRMKIHEMFLLSLSCSDLLFGLSNVGIQAAQFSRNDGVEDLMPITYSVYFLFVIASIFHLNAIALDRLWAIYKPLQHNVMVTKRRVRIFLILVWLCCTIAAVGLLVSSNYTNAFKRKRWRQDPLNLNETIVNNKTKLINSSSLITTLSNYNSNDTMILEVLKNFTTVNTPLFSSTKPALTRRRNPLQPKMRMEIEDMFANFMQNILSYFIVSADVMLVLTYGFIIHHVLSIKRRNEDSRLNVDCQKYKRVLVVCIWITLAFLAFTLPFPICRWTTGALTVWVNTLLVVNSGVNSVAYLVRGDYKQPPLSPRSGKELFTKLHHRDNTSKMKV